MGIIIRWGLRDYIYEDGKWRGFDTIMVARMNQALAESPVPPNHPDPGRYVYELAKRTNPSLWQYEVTFMESPVHPDDRAPTWLQCLFNPTVRRVFVHDLMTGWKHR